MPNRDNLFTSSSLDGTEIYVRKGVEEIDFTIEQAEDLLLDLGDALNIARWRRDEVRDTWP